MSHFRYYSDFIKRRFDIATAILGLIIFSPLLLAIALLVRSFLGSPVLFKQERPGIYTKPFTIFKFRTMKDTKDMQGNFLPDNLRLTRFGRLLRSSSLDELPELLNVIRGDMSLVGPRPLLMRYIPYFTEEELIRFNVRPGITGLAQIQGRSNLHWKERFAKDIWYVKNISFKLDLKILLITGKYVLKRKDTQLNKDNQLLRFDLDIERASSKNGII